MRLMRRKTLIIGALVTILMAIVGLAGVGWYYSNVLRNDALVVDHTPSEPDLKVVGITSDQVTLRMTDKAEADGPWTFDGIWGLEWDGGYAQVGAILQINDQEVIREFVPGTGDLSIGNLVRLDSFSFSGTPQVALGLDFDEVAYSSPLGTFPAWFIDGSHNTWAIFVHGRDAKREEALRMLHTVVELGFPSLVITYRNDEEAPASQDGLYQFGETEWRDLEAAAHYALDNGAEDIILVGYSMGGAIVTNFLYESPLAEQVHGAILDAPVLSFEAVIDYGASQRGIPSSITKLGKFIAGSRFDIDWDNRNLLSRVNELSVPILLFHGELDKKVHIKTSSALAEARPDLVTYVRVDDATHVRSWNMGPDDYNAAVGSFLRDLVQQSLPPPQLRRKDGR